MCSALVLCVVKTLRNVERDT